MVLCSLFCHFKPYILSQLLVLSLSLDNDAMATSKRCVKFFSLIFILKCLTKFNSIRVIIIIIIDIRNSFMYLHYIVTIVT